MYWGRMTDYEPYVADPTEPPPRRRLAGAAPAVCVIAVIVLLLGTASLLLEGRGEQDPSLSIPTEEPTERERGRGRRNND